jgi:hypothetical protein
MLKICILDENESKPIPPFLQNAFTSLGHKCLTAFVQEGQNKTAVEIAKFQPDLIVSIQNVGLSANFLTRTPLDKVRKAILFYDDPVGSLWLFGKQHPLFRNPNEFNVNFFIWDGYWRNRMQEITKASCFSTHLSAEPEYFSPGKKDLIPDIKHCVVFIGNVPKKSLLENIVQSLPDSHQKVGLAIEDKIASSSYGYNPFQALEDAIDAAENGTKSSILSSLNSYLNSKDQELNPFAPHIQLRRFAWLCGKRETRLRALKALSKVASIAILSNVKDEQYMGKEEFSSELSISKGNDLLFVDTSKVNYYQLGHLYASGLLHFQTTDPQSISGGIPYRVFQSAACGVPLISDSKKELEECFLTKKEIITYETDLDLELKINNALKTKSSLRDIGNAAYKRFLEEHTWNHRAKKILDDLQLK